MSEYNMDGYAGTNNNQNLSGLSGYNDSFLQSDSPRQKTKRKVIIAIVAVFVLSLILWLVTAIQMSRLSSPTTRSMTPTLQVYAVLEEGTPIEDLEGIVSAIDENLEVSIDETETAGEIMLPDANERIIFYYYNENELDEEDFEDDYDEIKPRTVFGINYEIGEGEVYRNIYYNSDQKTYYYYNGDTSFYAYNTKEEAIEGFLADKS